MPIAKFVNRHGVEIGGGAAFLRRAGARVRRPVTSGRAMVASVCWLTVSALNARRTAKRKTFNAHKCSPREHFAGGQKTLMSCGFVAREPDSICHFLLNVRTIRCKTDRENGHFVGLLAHHHVSMRLGMPRRTPSRSNRRISFSTLVRTLGGCVMPSRSLRCRNTAWRLGSSQGHRRENAYDPKTSSGRHARSCARRLRRASTRCHAKIRARDALAGAFPSSGTMA